MLIPDNEKLFEARNRLGFSLAQVANELNLPVTVIMAIEEGRYDVLHGEAFVCGVIGAYARLLDVESEALIKNYKKQCGLQVKVSKNPDDAIIDAHLSWRGFISMHMAAQHMKYRTAYGIAAVIALAMIIRVWSNHDNNLVENPVETTITIDTSMGTTIVSSLESMPVVSPTQDFVPEVELLSSGVSNDAVNAVTGFEKTIKTDNEENISSLSFTFVADCWVEVLDGNNEKIFASMQTANQKLVLTGKPPFRITLGYAPGVALSYNSQIVPINTDHTNVAKLVLGNS